MADINLAFSAYSRSLLPEAVALNVLQEKAPTKLSESIALIDRPGLADFTTIGTAPYRGVFQKDGLLDDATFVVAATACYIVTASGALTSVGGVPVAGDGAVVIDGGWDSDGNSIIRIATGSALYKYDSSTGLVVQETFPDSSNTGATSVAFWGGYWVATEPGTGFFYYIIPGGSSWNVLQFAGADYSPDPLKGARQFGELMGLMGSITTEFWRLTGEGTSPLEPVAGLKFDIGCRSILAAKNCAGDLIFVDNTGQVRRTNGGEPSLIGDFWVAELVSRVPAADLSADFYVKDGHPCYVLQIGTVATLVFDLSANGGQGAWTRFGSYGRDDWRPRFFATMGDTVLAFDKTSNQAWTLEPTVRLDGEDLIRREFCGFIEVKEGVLDLGNIELDCLTGSGPRMGQGADPLIGMSLCRDEETFGAIRYRPLNPTGQRRPLPKWNSLGSVGPPGVIVKWQVSDPVGLRVSGARYNVP